MILASGDNLMNNLRITDYDYTQFNEDEQQSDDKSKSKDESKLIKLISNVVKNYAASKAGDLLDELFMGNFKDAMIDIYKNKASEMNEQQLADAMKQLQEDPSYKKDKSYADLDSRKDTNKNANVDAESVRLWAIWKSKDKEMSVASVINEIVIDFQKQAVEVEKKKNELASKLKKLKIKISDEEFNKFGPMLEKVVEEGDPEKIKSKLDELKRQLDESYEMVAKRRYLRSRMLNEDMRKSPELEEEMFYDALLECKAYQEYLGSYMLNEGLGDIWKGFKNKVKEFSGKAIKTLTQSAIMPILSLGSIGMSVFTGGWAATGILRLMYAVERQGKKLRNSFERAYTTYANSKGIYAKMNFSIDKDKEQKYSLRFYEKDLVWRLINTTDQLKKPGIDYIKSILNGDEGVRFRKALQKTWDPLFLDTKGGKIDIKAILSQAKNIDIPEKYVDVYAKFNENYEQIKANCIDSPKIDTKRQS